MERSAVNKLAKAIATVHGHPDPDGYAKAVEEAYAGGSKPKAKGKAK